MKKILPLSYVEISRANLIHNIKQFRSLVRKGTEIAGVIKANAYGHGDVEVVKVLAPYVDYFQINSVEELVTLRKVTKKQILLLGYVATNDLSRAIKLGCALTVFDTAHAKAINAVARKMKRRQKVHIAVDSHLGREGVMPEELTAFLTELAKMKNLDVVGVYSHFANIEDTADFSYAQKQIDTYHKSLKAFEKFGWKNLKTHISATSGVLAYEKGTGAHTIVRVGVGLYGMWPSKRLEKIYENKITLKPVMRWVTHVAQVKKLGAGVSIGYGLSFITSHPTRIAVIPQGYSNGFPRSLSSVGSVLIGGTRCKVLGRVAMNMFVVDVTHAKNITEGAEVVVLGKQAKETITAEELAEKSGTINYEATTRVSPLLPRIVV